MSTLKNSTWKAELTRFQKILGYEFRDVLYLQTALTHSSYAHEHGVKDNERLEFLGDSVLQLIISDYFFDSLPEDQEGKLTSYRRTVVSEEGLLYVAQDLNLGRIIRLGKGEEKHGGSRKNHILADAVEALIGAIYKDGGYTAANTFVLTQFKPYFSMEKLKAAVDAKSALQELLFQTDRRPVYTCVGESGSDDHKTFTCDVSVDGKVIARGTGTSKKRAEKMAAQIALERLR
ncbi:ribonuclease III [Peptoniphilus equinus]|uniref:Ribonuclease 3 n=1 Tax=Peptoniphilus equinus TaxID=3016343 RepID=A0ABY7QV12_9FIRM|nr:ribonuclease III [Peptoniphilus equinus]WBW50619.1 ribonuclease III [Peptoniphilus equinus]